MYIIIVRNNTDLARQLETQRRHRQTQRPRRRIRRIWTWLCEQNRILSEAFEYVYQPWRHQH